MGFANEILDAIEIMVKQAVEDNTTKIYTGVCKTVATTTCTLTINGKDNAVKYYGGTPIAGNVYQVFIPFGNMSAAFIIVPGAGGDTPETGVTSVNGKTGNVVLNASDVGALPNTTVIPTKTSQLNNDSGFVDAAGASAAAPVQSVNAKTGAVVLTQDDVGNGTTYVRTHNDFTDVAKQQINTNEDNIAMLDSDMEAAQGDITTLKGNVTTLTTALQSKQDIITGGASTITDDNLTVNRALVSDGNGKVVVSNVTNTELSYLDGVTSNVQTQLNKKLESAPVTSVNTKTGAVVLTASDVGALSDTTIIPIVNDATLDVQRNGVSVGTFTANASTDKTINITVPTKASDVGALPDTTSIPSKTSELDNDSGFITSAQVPVTSVNTKTGAVTLVKSDIGLSNVDNVKQYSASNPPPYPVTSVNGQIGAVSLGASDVGALSTSDVTTTLGTSTTKVPSEKAVSDALSAAGGGDMLKATYDPTGSVAQVGGIPAYVEANGGKIDTIKINGTAQAIVDKAVDITVPTKTSDLTNDSGFLTSAPVTSVNSKTGVVKLTARDVGAINRTGDSIQGTFEFGDVYGGSTIITDSTPSGMHMYESAPDNYISMIVPSDVSENEVGFFGGSIMSGGTMTVGSEAVRLVNIGKPVKNTDAANKAYVDENSGIPIISLTSTDGRSFKGTVDDISTIAKEGNVIAVKVGYTATSDSITLNLNNTTAYEITRIGTNGKFLDGISGIFVKGAVILLQCAALSSDLKQGIWYIVGFNNKDVSVPDNLVSYATLSDVQSVDTVNADTLQGHNADYFATASGLSTTNAQVATNINNIGALQTAMTNKLDKSGGAMTGALVAQNNANYTTAQVRNIIISTADPSGGSNGMIWIKYTP